MCIRDSSTIALLERIREVINKRIQEKKKNEFTDLAPIDDIENGAEYLNALHLSLIHIEMCIRDRCC